MQPEFGIPVIGSDVELIQGLTEGDLRCEKPRRPAAGSGGQQQRRQARYDVQHPVTCYQVLPSLEIDASCSRDGLLENVSNSGISLVVQPDGIKPGDHLLIAVDIDGESKFTDVNVIDTSDTNTNSTRIHASADGPLQRIFGDDFVLPVLDTDRFQYLLPFAESVFRSLVSIGAAQRTVMDQILVCPDCLSVPTVRKGCSHCLSHETAMSRMIHHFACAHVDFIERFDQGSEIACPKCRGRKMVIGADFEYLDGPVECGECGHQNMEEVLIGHCLRCSNRFPFDNARTREIVGYRVNRLDTLDLLDRN